MYFLDEDPILSARYLIKRHIFIQIMKVQIMLSRMHGKEISTMKKKYVMTNSLLKFINYSSQNYEWVAAHLKELFKIHGTNYRMNGFTDDFYEVPEKLLKKNKGLCFNIKGIQSVDTILSGVNLTLVSDKILIRNSRIAYLTKKFEERYFLNGYPQWYSDFTGVFKTYNSINKTNIKIVLTKKGYTYYYNNNILIRDVPPEMDLITNALIYKLQNKPWKEFGKLDI